MVFLSENDSVNATFSTFAFSPLFDLDTGLLVSCNLGLMVDFPSFVSTLPLCSSLTGASFTSSVPFPDIDRGLFVILFTPSLDLVVVSSLFSTFLVTQAVASLRRAPPGRWFMPGIPLYFLRVCTIVKMVGFHTSDYISIPASPL